MAIKSLPAGTRIGSKDACRTRECEWAKRKRTAVTVFVLFLCATALSACSRLDSIDYNPKITPEEFLGAQPYLHVRFPVADFILIQPSSTVIVYSVALLTLGVGLHLLRVRHSQQTRLWWGIGLLLTGFGALLAGTSYQAFGYEIKCAGRAFCTWTSWWEVTYLLFSAAGMNAMLVATAYSCTTGSLRTALSALAVAGTAIYTGVVLTGAFVPVRFLVSFECLMLAAAPAVALALILTGSSYYKRRDPMNLALLRTWAGFVMVIVAYVVALAMGITQTLRTRGIWFTENDVLHVGMILWILHIAVSLPKTVEDMRDSRENP